jgi:hypothetical protein
VVIFFSFECRPYYDQIYNCNLEISPTQAIIKRNGQNWLMHSKVTGLPKALQPLTTVVNGRCSGP